EWTETAYLGLDTNRLIELSAGCLEFLPMPTIFHQLIVQYLLRKFGDFITGRFAGMFLTAPLPVRLWAGKYREPDIVYLKPERVPSVHGQPLGADMALEVVSAGEENRVRD